jgi:formate/nitrite transporter
MRDSVLADQAITTRPSDHGTYVGTPVVDYVRGPQVVQTMIEAGASKKDLSAGEIFVRGMFGGAFLGFGTSLAFLAVAQGIPPIVAALIFPVGFICITLLGVDLITGYFALVPLAFIHRRMTFGELLRAWFWVWLGNLAGGVLYAGMLWAGFTLTGRAPDGTGLGAVVTKIGLFKTVHYEQFGTAGAFAAFVKGMLCNWMVTLGVVLPMASRSVIGKVVATYVPIFMFFGMGYEHMVVNMFIIPAAMFFGAPISMSDFWVGNELPVTIGNFAGGFLFTGAALGWLYRTRGTVEEPIPPLGRPAPV